MVKCISFSIHLVLFSCLKLIFCHVIISSPQDLQVKFPDPIKSAYSNFGKIPYGYFTMGRLYYNPNNKDLDYACKSLIGYSLAPEPSIDRYPIIMVDRGNCSFVTKTRNVQNLGGHLALIVDNTDEPIENILMTDDGTGSDIMIPAVLISKKDGDKIKEFFLKNENDESLLSSIVVSVEFKMVKTKTVEYQIFFSSANKRIYRLMTEFYPYYEYLKEYTKFTPHYISHESPLYDEKRNINLDHCLSNGKYCTSPRYDMGISNGREILFEDLRQKCIYNTNQDSNEKYYKYLKNFYQKCISITNPRFNIDCSLEVIESIDIDSLKMTKCIHESFNVTVFSELMYNNQNKLLEEDFEVKKIWNVKMFPTIMVNNKTIHGAWSAQNLFEAICAGFEVQPPKCTYFFTPGEKSDSNDFSYGTIFFIILLVIALNILIIYVCRKYIVRRIHERVDNVDIDGRINNVVNSYLALRETK